MPMTSLRLRRAGAPGRLATIPMTRQGGCHSARRGPARPTRHGVSRECSGYYRIEPCRGRGAKGSGKLQHEFPIRPRGLNELDSHAERPSEADPVAAPDDLPLQPQGPRVEVDEN